MRRMHAITYESQGPARQVLRYGPVDFPAMGEGDVLVRLYASGVNPSDVKTRAGLRGGMPYPMIVPHSDGAGVVEAAGRNVSRFKAGDRVWVYNAAWERSYGTAAEYVALPESLVVSLPPTLSFEEGACLGIPALTAAACLLCLPSLAGKTVVVTAGAGSVGNLAIQLAKHNGSVVITTVSSGEKGALARQAGADIVIDYRSEDVLSVVQKFTHGAGADLIVDVDFGANLHWTVSALKTGGHIASYASAARPRPELPFYDMMFKGIILHMILVYQLAEDTRRQALAMLEAAACAGVLHPLVGPVFPLDKAIEAHEAVEKPTAAGTVIVQPGG